MSRPCVCIKSHQTNGLYHGGPPATMAEEPKGLLSNLYMKTLGGFLVEKEMPEMASFLTPAEDLKGHSLISCARGRPAAKSEMLARVVSRIVLSASRVRNA